MQTERNPLSASDIISALAVVVIWGLNFIAIKIGTQEVPPIMLCVLRFIAVIFPFIFFFPRPPVAWRWLIALGLTLNAGQFALLFLGIKLGISAGLASIVLQAQTFFTLLFAVLFLGERCMKNHLVGLFLATIGMLVIGLKQGANMTLIGFWMTVAAAANGGAGNVIIRKVTQETPSFSMIALLVWAGAVAIIPTSLLSLLVDGIDTWKTALSNLSWRTFASLAYLSYVAIFAGFGLWGKLLSRHPAGVVSSFGLLVPIVGIVSSALLLGESLTVWQIIGVVLVMFGLSVTVLGTGSIKSRKEMNIHS